MRKALCKGLPRELDLVKGKTFRSQAIAEEKSQTRIFQKGASKHRILLTGLRMFGMREEDVVEEEGSGRLSRVGKHDVPEFGITKKCCEVFCCLT